MKSKQFFQSLQKLFLKQNDNLCDFAQDSKKNQFVDDGRTIANMNLPGMPWFNKSNKYSSKLGNRQNNIIYDFDQKIPSKNKTAITLTKKEFCAILKAAFAVTIPLIALFALAYATILVFLQLVWLQ